MRSQLPPWVLPVVAGAGVLAWAGTRRAGGAAGGGRTQGTGWASGSSVVLSPKLSAWLDRLAARVPFALYVTSGIRTPAAQARAWAAKIAQGETRADLLRLYRADDLVRDAWPDPSKTPTVAELAAAFNRQAARGRYLSSHMTGRALDLRSTGGSAGSPGRLSAAQVERVSREARALGARVVVEQTPPHIHLEVPV